MHVDDIDWSQWHPTVRCTLLFVLRDGQVLLIRKKRGLGAGKINGPGGKLDPGETPLECAFRETQEELGIQPTQVEEAGKLYFDFVDGLRIECTVFKAEDCVGAPTETEEAIPLWTSVDAVPYDEMWADDRYWLPALLAGRTFSLWATFDDDALLDHRLSVG
ncbi:MAG: 8-oxo-dGTP diphosphatase [Bradymonadia bacterium]